MLTVNVGLSFFGGTRMSSLSVNAADLFVLSQEVVLNQYTSEQYFSNITARLVVSAPESHHSNGIVKSVLFGTALSCKSVFFFTHFLDFAHIVNHGKAPEGTRYWTRDCGKCKNRTFFPDLSSFTELQA